MRLWMVALKSARIGRLSFFGIFLLTASGWGFAQDPAVSLDQLKLLVDQGDKVTLVDPAGSKITGRIERIDSNLIEMRTGDTVRTFKEEDIHRITQRKHDPVWNGILIGAAVGFGSTLPVNLAIAERGENDIALAASALWGLIGGGIGALVDASVTQKRLVYFRPRRSISWSIYPCVSGSASRLEASAIGASRRFSPASPGKDPSKGIAIAVRF